MNWRGFCSPVLAFFLLSGAPAYPHPQDTPPAAPPAVAAPKPPRAQFFAGLVIEAGVDHVKVSRTLIGRQPETRVFMLDGKTKTPKGGIRLKSRVTVRYEHLPEHDLALEIQVRSPAHAPKPS